MGGRVVYGTGLENRRARKGTGGSNPSPSASHSLLIFHNINNGQLDDVTQSGPILLHSLYLAHHRSPPVQLILRQGATTSKPSSPPLPPPYQPPRPHPPQYRPDACAVTLRHRVGGVLLMVRDEARASLAARSVIVVRGGPLSSRFRAW